MGHYYQTGLVLIDFEILINEIERPLSLGGDEKVVHEYDESLLFDWIGITLTLIEPFDFVVQNSFILNILKNFENFSIFQLKICLLYL